MIKRWMLGSLLLLQGFFVPVTAHGYSLLFTGDVHFAELYHAAGLEEKMSPIYHSLSKQELLSGLEPFMQSADGVIINLESPITKLKKSPFENKKNYTHREEPASILSFLKTYPIRGVSLANNHALDFGKIGLLETFIHLQKNQIPFIGAGKKRADAAAPLLFDVPLSNNKWLKLAVFAGFEKRTSYKKQYDYYVRNTSAGVISLNDTALLRRIKEMKQYDKERKIIFYPHWGKDYQDVNSSQQKWAQQLLDAGVDLILGHGTHAMQQIAIQDERLVVFGMGNFAYYTPGLYRRYKSHPYSLVSRIIFSEKSYEIRMYPLITNHRIIKFRTRAVNAQEWEEVCQIIKKDTDPEVLKRMNAQKDHLGYYFSFDLKENLRI